MARVEWMNAWLNGWMVGWLQKQQSDKEKMPQLEMFEHINIITKLGKREHTHTNVKTNEEKR